MDINKLLDMMIKKKASDLFITVGIPPTLKIDGKIHPVSNEKLTAEHAEKMVFSIMTSAQKEFFIAHHECNFAISPHDKDRFRVSAFFQRNLVGMVLRLIETQIPTIESLNLPPILEELSMIKRGMVLFVGATGVGKSTSLAAMIGHRNRNSTGHIVTIEDPIEFVHQHEGCIVTQREVGIDTERYEVALKNTLRQAPNVIMIGEVRTRNTMEYTVSFAETGHLCLTTLHANNANQALDRIFHFFPQESHRQLCMDLSLNLKAIVAQQLVPTADGKGRHVVTEIMINTPIIADHIRKGEVHIIKDIMGKSTEQGMQTFDQGLYRLYVDSIISYDDAMTYADSKNDLRLMIKLSSEVEREKLSNAANAFNLERKEEGSGMYNGR